LNLQEEWLYPVGGLTYPTESDNGADAAQYAAVQLFSERAKHVYPSFKSAEEISGIIRICRLVAGMPLALELAAAWRRTLTCEAIADEIQHSLDFLSTRLRNVPERHRSIQVVFDQTWQQLMKREQEVFMRLSVFHGGFQRQAAEAVSGASLPVLMVLVDISLLRIERDGRYQIHELLHQYGAEKLGRSSKDTQQARTDHAAYYANYLYQLREELSGGGQQNALLAIQRELENIRVAWQFMIEDHDFAGIRKASSTLGLYYDHQGGYLEGLNLFSKASDVLSTQPSSPDVDYALVDILLYLSWYQLRFGNLEQIEQHMAMSLGIYERLNVPPTPGAVSDPHLPLGFVALTRGDYAAAVQHAEQARLVAEAQQHTINREFAYYVLSSASLGQGQYETGQLWAQRAADMAESSGDRWFLAYILNNLGLIAVALGDDRKAQGYFRSSYDIRESFNDPEGMALALNHLGDIALGRRDFGAAEERYLRSLALYREINDKGGIATSNKGLGDLSLQQGDYSAAQDYLRQALQLGVEINYRPLLMAVLVDIAELLWRKNHRQRALTLLSFTANDPTCDRETTEQAKARLFEVYKTQVDENLFETAVTAAEASDLDNLTAALLEELKQPNDEIDLGTSGQATWSRDELHDRDV
jgi:tetratricopeptide (TPR) repeat protein